MPATQRGGIETIRNGSRLRSLLSQEPIGTSAESSDQEEVEDNENRLHVFLPRRTEASSARLSFSSLNQKTPARSYFNYRSFHDAQGIIPQTLSHEATRSRCTGSINITQNAPYGVREDTAELASLALSDIASYRSGNSPSRHNTSSPRQNTSSSFPHLPDETDSCRKESNKSPRPDPIEEVMEPSSPHNSESSPKSPGKSALTEMIRNWPPIDQDTPNTDDEDALAGNGIQPVIVKEGIISQPSEQTSLLLKRSAWGQYGSLAYASVRDLESQKKVKQGPLEFIKMAAARSQDWTAKYGRVVANPKSWNWHTIWKQGVRQPIAYLPPVMLGLLLNILDALSYGMILFPLGQPVFANLGPDGISMFYVSCIVSQLVYSCGGSIFKGGLGSEMIEVVPFFHTMAFTILARVGEDNPKSVLATTILSYSMSSVLTGAAFFLMGKCKLGTLIGFFPRHILIGCIGGVGWFLVATGLEVSARLDGNLEYNIPTLKKLFQADTISLWIIPLALAISLLILKRWVKHPLTDATYFLSIIAIFYFFELVIPELSLPQLRSAGWVFEAPEAGVPWYHFYSLFGKSE